MARYTASSCRICRREGQKLFLKGTRCTTAKCAIAKREYAPGQHGQRRRTKLSNYAVQLREKQKVKKIYGLLERQFHITFTRAARHTGVTGETLLQFLERRVDNCVFRLGFATSRPQARQIVKHGGIFVNGRRVDIPSYQVKVGDSIEMKGTEKRLKGIRDIVELTKDRGVPGWLEVDKEKLIGRVTRLPARDDVGFPIKEQLIVELYSK